MKELHSPPKWAVDLQNIYMVVGSGSGRNRLVGRGPTWPDVCVVCCADSSRYETYKTSLPIQYLGSSGGVKTTSHALIDFAIPFCDVHAQELSDYGMAKRRIHPRRYNRAWGVMPREARDWDGKEHYFRFCFMNEDYAHRFESANRSNLDTGKRRDYSMMGHRDHDTVFQELLQK